MNARPQLLLAASADCRYAGLPHADAPHSSRCLHVCQVRGLKSQMGRWDGRTRCGSLPKRGSLLGGVGGEEPFCLIKAGRRLIRMSRFANVVINSEEISYIKLINAILFSICKRRNAATCCRSHEVEHCAAMRGAGPAIWPCQPARRQRITSAV